MAERFLWKLTNCSVISPKYFQVAQLFPPLARPPEQLRYDTIFVVWAERSARKVAVERSVPFLCVIIFCCWIFDFFWVGLSIWFFLEKWKALRIDCTDPRLRTLMGFRNFGWALHWPQHTKIYNAFLFEDDLQLKTSSN